MHYTLKPLRDFNAALRTGSISRAAKEMSISQNSITAAIDMIEQSIGAELMRRMPAKGIVAPQTGPNDRDGRNGYAAKVSPIWLPIVRHSLSVTDPADASLCASRAPTGQTEP